MKLTCVNRHEGVIVDDAFRSLHPLKCSICDSELLPEATVDPSMSVEEWDTKIAPYLRTASDNLVAAATNLIPQVKDSILMEITITAGFMLLLPHYVHFLKKLVTHTTEPAPAVARESKVTFK